MLKTKKAISKRFKITGNGNIMFRSPGHRHFLRNRTIKQRRAACKDHLLSPAFKKQILRAVSVGL